MLNSPVITLKNVSFLLKSSKILRYLVFVVVVVCSFLLSFVLNTNCKHFDDCKVFFLL